jgi:hypothetical protein
MADSSYQHEVNGLSKHSLFFFFLNKKNIPFLLVWLSKFLKIQQSVLMSWLKWPYVPLYCDHSELNSKSCNLSHFGDSWHLHIVPFLPCQNNSCSFISCQSGGLPSRNFPSVFWGVFYLTPRTPYFLYCISDIIKLLSLSVYLPLHF